MGRYKPPLQGISKMSDRVGSGSGLRVVGSRSSLAGATVTLPELEAGDLIVCLASNSNSSALPGAASGYTTIATNTAAVSGTASASRAMFRIADGTETSVTSAGATGVGVAVYRGASGIGNYVTQSITNSTNPITTSAITLQNEDSLIAAVFGAPIEHERDGAASTLSVLNYTFGYTTKPEPFAGRLYSRIFTARGYACIYVEVLAA